MQTLLDACQRTQTHYNAHQATTQAPARDRLVDYSPGDRPWDVHRAQADAVAAIYAGAKEFERYAQRIGTECSGVLRFGWRTDPETGESKLRLREVHFCRVRHCPVCQWRRSLMWKARFYQAIPTLAMKYPNARWLFLTLTVRNCQVTELRKTILAMNAGWQRLIKRKEFAPVLGWIRATEVTRSDVGDAHPHFHVLMMVPPKMLSGRCYVTHRRWVELWRDCMRLDYDPVVDIRTVKGSLHDAVVETLKYSVKPDDMDDTWLLELTRQTYKLRFIASGGALKGILRESEELDEDLALLGERDDDEVGQRLAFAWDRPKRHYRRAPKHDDS